jgi:hypothetical protein
MLKEPKTMAELHKIREAHYETTRNKTLNFVMRETAKEAKAVMKKYNLKLRYAKKLETTHK